MRRQRNMSQMKEQNKTLEKQLNKMEISNLLDAKLKTLVIRMINELRGRVNELSENFNKEIRNIKTESESIKKNHSEMKNTLIEMRNVLQGIVEKTKQRIKSEI